MAGPVPARISWAMERLDLQPDDEVLEIGCGPGAALQLACRILDGGHITGIDRSATAVDRASARLAGELAAGKAALATTALAALEAPPSSFDKAFAVNINTFWTGPADAELLVLRRVLRPGGLLLLVYETPGRPDRQLEGAASALRAHGLRPEILAGPGPKLGAVTARL
ncbi:SAM-dependent methyltransferase [Arthrobacter sp. USHLN218]|uniref:SAM-dependent methyltransferase n=1 Tax=Arthrobacter sp. USHLN218 TaxID=3081232 RepID=UPI0030194FE6